MREITCTIRLNSCWKPHQCQFIFKHVTTPHGVSTLFINLAWIEQHSCFQVARLEMFMMMMMIVKNGTENNQFAYMKEDSSMNNICLRVARQFGTPSPDTIYIYVQKGFG